MAKMVHLWFAQANILCTHLEKAGYKIKQSEWDAYFDWYLQAYRRG